MNRSLVPLLLVTLAGGTSAGCNEAAAAVVEPLQGIVEHDERILGFEVGGRVLEVTARRGALVNVNDVLVRIDDTLERPLRDARLAEVAAATAQLELVRSGARSEELRGIEAELRAVTSQLELTDRTRARQAALVERGALPSGTLDELDGTRTTLIGRREVLEQHLRGLRRGARREEIDGAQARLSAAEAGLATVETRLSRYTLTSPGKFHVTEVHAQPGEMVGPGSPAVTAADLDHPYVDVFVPEGRITEVTLGQRARVRVDGLAAPLDAEVEHIANRTEFTPRFLFSESERPNLVLRVRVRVTDPRHRLRAGIPAFVTLDGASASR